MPTPCSNTAAPLFPAPSPLTPEIAHDVTADADETAAGGVGATGSETGGTGADASTTSVAVVSFSDSGVGSTRRSPASTYTLTAATSNAGTPALVGGYSSNAYRQTVPEVRITQ